MIKNNILKNYKKMKNLVYYLFLCIYTCTYIYTTLIILTVFGVQWFYFCGGELILSQPLGDGVNSDFPVEIGESSNNNQNPATSAQSENSIGENYNFCKKYKNIIRRRLF